MAQKLIAKGAEADVFTGSIANIPAVFKKRKPKAYRVKALDEAIRSTRTKKEARLLHAAKSAGAKCPLVLSVGKNEIAMTRLNGKLMRELDERKMIAVAPAIGTLLASLHSAGITHGDFTPANIMVDGREVAVIDFGLGEFARDDEELATDLLLMKKSVPAAAYAAFLKAYCKARGPGAQGKAAVATLARLEEIEKRGRYVVRGALA
ncbi:MAG: KEOPS complex kinase/ATPase Bud32 [Candidatus Burarchaeum sp.]|nr:KEOPS complex kinase/ATPase Bud32 [Candidatus Burarchaeum sp.]MDO8339114.1 KEOPS complex kinase/ATPase Bud32 [Candidatus Burarchaeum sp.]